MSLQLFDHEGRATREAMCAREDGMKREYTIARPGRSRPANLRDQISNSHLWPTPRSCSAMAAVFIPAAIAKAHTRFPNLESVVQRYPTPASMDWKDNGHSPAELNRNSTTLATIAGGSLNPTWVEWLMGFPAEWTALKDSEMPLSRPSPKSSDAQSCKRKD